MSSSGFGVPALKKLLDKTNHNHEVVAVFTHPPKPKGRGLKFVKSEIHQIAEEYSIEVCTPNNLKSKENQDLVNNIDADIIVVVSYGFIIPLAILESKKYGCINIHPSALPKYRGAAPLQYTILNGDTRTAVCIMQMDVGIDTGDILLRKDFDISDRINFPQLHEITSEIGAEMLIEVLNKIDIIPRMKQPLEEASYASKITKDMGKIDWNETAESIDRKVRAMNPYPSSYFYYNNSMIKVLSSSYRNETHQMQPGTAINDNLEIACKDGVLVIEELQLEGRKAMKVKEFLRGTPIPKSSILS